MRNTLSLMNNNQKTHQVQTVECGNNINSAHVHVQTKSQITPFETQSVNNIFKSCRLSNFYCLATKPSLGI